MREKLISICFREFCNIASDSPCGCDACPYGSYDTENGECYEMYKKHKLEKLAEEGVTVQQWIPVTERLPFAEYGESNDVLAVTELDVIRVLYFDGGNWCFQNGECCPHKVTHWMPLPEPPKED